MLELAREYNCPIRRIIARTDADQPVGLPSALANSVRDFAPALLAEFAPRSPDVFYATFYDEWATKEHLLDLIAHLPASATAGPLTLRGAAAARAATGPDEAAAWPAATPL